MFHNLFDPPVHRSDQDVAPRRRDPGRGPFRGAHFRLLGGQMKTRSGNVGLLQVLCVGLVLALSLLPQPVAGQAVTGTLLGTVRDASGGALPGASVTLVNTGTGFSRTVTTDATGEYTAPLMPTGDYTVAVEMGGFKKVTISN